MRLIADAMLGRLAKWLRILGYDTAYLADTDDFAVMRLARAEDRLILTRDRALAGRQGVRALLVESEILEEQLCQVWADVGPSPDPPFSRCPVCNQPLVEAAPELVAARVPPHVQRTHERFSLCIACDRLYWPGSHWRRMQARVTGLRDAAGFDTIESAARDS
jgi:uncharacterized protein with PIN domain